MITNIPISHPAISQLRLRVEHKLGTPIVSQQAIHQLEAAVNFAVNEDTLRRLWHFRHDSYSSVRHSTLDALAAYATGQDWDTFSTMIQTQAAPESRLLLSTEHVTTDQLPEGTILELSWLPDRLCRIRYVGKCQWVVLSVEHSTTLSPEDTFYCRLFAANQVAYLDNLCHDGINYPASRIGTQSGLASVRII